MNHLIAMHPNNTTGRLTTGKPRKDAATYAAMAAALVDEWAPVWSLAMSLRVDGLLLLADHLHEEERF